MRADAPETKRTTNKKKLLSAGLEPVTYYLEIQYCPLSAKSDSWESVAQYETNSVFCESVQNFLPNVIPIPKWLVIRQRLEELEKFDKHWRHMGEILRTLETPLRGVCRKLVAAVIKKHENPRTRLCERSGGEGRGGGAAG